MNKATMQVYNINSQGSFCFSELLLKGSEQSYRQIGQSCCNGIYIILKLIRPHQRTAQSPVPVLRVAPGLRAFWLPAPDHSICITPAAEKLIQSHLRSIICISSSSFPPSLSSAVGWG